MLPHSKKTRSQSTDSPLAGLLRIPLASYEVTVELLGMSHDVIAKVGMLEHPRAKDMIIGRLLLHHYKMEWNVPLGSFTVTPLSDSKP